MNDDLPKTDTESLSGTAQRLFDYLELHRYHARDHLHLKIDLGMTRETAHAAAEEIKSRGYLIEVMTGRLDYFKLMEHPA